MDPSDLAAVLRAHLADPASSFSIGSFGAIAEFHRDVGEPLAIDDPAGLTVATARGAIRIALRDDVRPLAWETPSRTAGRWQHGVMLCLPHAAALGHRRTVLTELGPDRAALRAADREAVLFDMGVGALNVDFCLRTDDPGLLAVLRRHAGGEIFGSAAAAMPAILEANPHRVALSPLGRVEVYQPIGRDATPEGPHTHLLPKLLKSGRTHAADLPMSHGHLPAVSLYPPHPLSADGRFDPARHAAFQRLLAAWGPPGFADEKARVAAALRAGGSVEDWPDPGTRAGRQAVRVAERQVAAASG